MRVSATNPLHLTYCTNVHAGTSWQEMTDSLKQYVPALKAQLSPDAPFGIGPRVAGEASRELLEDDALARFQAFLTEHDLYVYTINGFPYGPFHGQAVKDNVHAPDWRNPERVAYTHRLTDILAALLPEGMDGGISTSPLTYRPWVEPVDDAMWEHFVRQLVDVTTHMREVHERTGKLIHLDLEPEPDGLLGACADLITFYDTWLLPRGTELLAERLSVQDDEAREILLAHMQVCFDTCHVAVGYESPADVLQAFDERGIRVGKVQVSSALRADIPVDPQARERLVVGLQAFDEPVYLHQVVQRNVDDTLTHYPDLGLALEHGLDNSAQEWRIHFHVPIFIEHYAASSSTQQAIRETFAVLAERRFTNHLEIETYTWDVLPGELKEDLLTSIKREYEWVLETIS
ncbi:MAG: metabolite traffic protein EboE [Chloroflexota bacterium]|nr:metabolite traffic protein EboE [Chloroflexota bacterium]